jgi:surface antigen
MGAGRGVMSLRSVRAQRRVPEDRTTFPSARLRGLVVAFSGVLALIAVTAPRAGATVICRTTTGYSCALGGYSAASARMSWWWQLYGGSTNVSYDKDGGPHNCTLYAAYRLAQNGYTPGRNASGGLIVWGNASDWAHLAKQLSGVPVNHSPAVGSIAQWNTTTGPNAKDGHVAYVETVGAGGGTIVISEDMYGFNETAQETLTRGSPGWPDSFIHARDLAPVPGDINRDEVVDQYDLSRVLQFWHDQWIGLALGDYVVHPTAELLNTDLNGDRQIDAADLFDVLRDWGGPVPGSGQAVAGPLALRPLAPAARRTGSPRRAPPRVSVVAGSSRVAAGGKGLLSAETSSPTSCRLGLLGPGRHAPSSAAITLTTARRYATWRWRVPANARAGAWVAHVTCRAARVAASTSQAIDVTGRASGTGAAVTRLFGSAAAQPPVRRPGGSSVAPCAGAATPDRASGYCRGSAAYAVYLERPDVAGLGPLRGWWAAGAGHEGLVPRVGAIAWWKPSATQPRGHVAYIDRIDGRWLWVSEADVYATGMSDRARVPAAASGYLYVPPIPPTPPAPAPGAASAATWPQDAEALAGDTFTMSVELNITSGAPVAAQAHVDYPANTLRLISVQAATGFDPDATLVSPWGHPQASGPAGQLEIETTATGAPVEGSSIMAVLTFQALAPTAAGRPVSLSVSAQNAAGSQLAVTSANNTISVGPAPPPPAAATMSFTSTVQSPALQATHISSVASGTQFVVPVYVHIPVGQINVVSPVVDYPAGLLDLVSVTPDTTNWPTMISDTSSPGTVNLDLSGQTAQSGDVHVADLTFQAIATGNATLTFGSASIAADANDDAAALQSTAGETIVVTP